MQPLIKETVPIRILSEANMRLEHWAVRKKRHNQHWFFIKQQLRNNEMPKEIDHIVLTRIAPRLLDADNLPGALKWYIDCIADWINPGLPPGHADRNMKFECKQEKGKPKQYGLRIEIY
jgi:hypothetical protein